MPDSIPSPEYDLCSARQLADKLRRADEHIERQRDDFARAATSAANSIERLATSTERLTAAITEAEAILRGSFRRPAKEVNAAAAEARRVLSEAIGKPTAKKPQNRMPTDDCDSKPSYCSHPGCRAWRLAPAGWKCASHDRPE